MVPGAGAGLEEAWAGGMQAGAEGAGGLAGAWGEATAEAAATAAEMHPEVCLFAGWRLGGTRVVFWGSLLCDLLFEVPLG